MELEALLVIIIFIFVAITIILGTVVVIMYQKIKEMFDFTLLITAFYEKERDKKEIIEGGFSAGELCD